MKQNIVFFDGDCVQCNSFVKFTFRNLKNRNVYFASQNSKLFDEIIRNRNLCENTIYFLKSGVFYSKSKAIFYIFGTLKFPFSLFSLLRFFPMGFMDLFYDYYANYSMLHR